MDKLDIWGVIALSHLVILPVIFIKFNILQAKELLEGKKEAPTINFLIGCLLVGCVFWPITDSLLIVHFTFKGYFLSLLGKGSGAKPEQNVDVTKQPVIGITGDSWNDSTTVKKTSSNKKKTKKSRVVKTKAPKTMIDITKRPPEDFE